MKKSLTIVTTVLGIVALLAAWADSTPVASLAETRPFAAGAALAGLALLALRIRYGGWSRPVALSGLLGAAGLVWSLYLLGFAYRSRDITFENGDVRLAGTLYSPRSEAPRATAVFIHGSGAATRTEFLFQAKLLARHGMAALVYDKRGSGESGGDLAAPYEVYAEDAIAARRTLGRQAGIDPATIGFFGHSEGAWVAPIAAGRSGCAFVVATGATDLTPAQQVLYESLAQVRRAGFDEETVETVERLQREVLDYQRTGRAPDGLAEELEAAAAEPWAGPAELPSRLWPPEDYAWWRSVMDFDPLAAWRRVDCPVLLLSGGLDTKSDVAESQTGIEEAVESGGGPEVTTVVFPRADHMVLEWPLGDHVPPPRWPAGYRDTLVDWILEHVESGARPERP